MAKVISEVDVDKMNRGELISEVDACKMNQTSVWQMQADGGIFSNQAAANSSLMAQPSHLNDMSDSDRRNNTTNTFVNKEHMRGQVCIRADNDGRGCYPSFGANNIEGNLSRPLQIPTEMVNYAINEDSHLSSNLDTYKYMMTPAKRVRHV